MNEREHLYTILQEECAEVIQCISKIKRFGLTNTQPHTGKLNLQLLNEEVNDLLALIEMLQENGVPITKDIEKIREKKEKVKHFLGISKLEGTLK